MRESYFLKRLSTFVMVSAAFGVLHSGCALPQHDKARSVTSSKHDKL